MKDFNFVVKFIDGTKEKYVVDSCAAYFAWIKLIISLKEHMRISHVVSIKLKKETENEEN